MSTTLQVHDVREVVLVRRRIGPDETDRGYTFIALEIQAKDEKGNNTTFTLYMKPEDAPKYAVPVQHNNDGGADVRDKYDPEFGLRYEQIRNALLVFVLAPALREYLKENDPQALLQAQAALAGDQRLREILKTDQENDNA